MHLQISLPFMYLKLGLLIFYFFYRSRRELFSKGYWEGISSENMPYICKDLEWNGPIFQMTQICTYNTYQFIFKDLCKLFSSFCKLLMVTIYCCHNVLVFFLAVYLKTHMVSVSINVLAADLKGEAFCSFLMC